MMAEQATTLMKSRRHVASPKGSGVRRLLLTAMRLQQGFVTDGMGFRVKLRGSNFEPLMFALGQKRTSQRVGGMSALPPKADMDQLGCDVRFVPIADILSRGPMTLGAQK